MPDAVLRTPVLEDAEAIAALCNAVTRDLYGEEVDVDAAFVRTWFSFTGLRMRVAERDGRLVGYCDTDGEEGRPVDLDLRVHPDARGTGAAELLLDDATGWVLDSRGPGSRIHATLAERDHALRAVFDGAGFAPIRHAFHMEIALDGPTPEPEWPEGVSVRRCDPARDEAAVHACHQDAFRDHWGFHEESIERWREFMTASERFDPSLWWLAEAGGELAGICLNAWHFSGDPHWGWVGVLGVRRPWRRHGLGRALLLHSFRDFAGRGATRVGLGVDGESLTGAVRLYERAGMHVVRRYDTLEQELP